jgi:hypothetical protein
MPRRKIPQLLAGEFIYGEMPTGADLATIATVIQTNAKTQLLSQASQDVLALRVGAAVAFARCHATPTEEMLALARQKARNEAVRVGKIGVAVEEAGEGAIKDLIGDCRMWVLPWLSGKRAKCVAWNLDIFVRDLCDAWKEAGLRPTVRDDASGKSDFIRFVEDVLTCVAIPWGGSSLRKNANRAQNFERGEIK